MINFAYPLSEFQFLEKNILKEIKKVLNSNNYILGKQVKKFEKNFSKLNNSKFCVGVSSGTDALIIAIKSLDIGYKDKILVPSHTAPATIASIIEVGAHPIFVDVNEEFNIDENKLPKKLNSKVKAIIAVHLYGNPCNMDLILKFAKKYNLKVIEDCSQAHFAEFKKKKVGNFGDLACYSFYPTKNVSAIGDAGAVITNSNKYFKKCKLIRQYGWIKKNVSVINGSNKRLDEIQAAILNVKLKKSNLFTKKRIGIAKQYLSRIKNQNLLLPKINSNKKHVFHLFVLRITNNKREKCINLLKKHNINPAIHYDIPNHKQKIYKKYSNKSLKFTEYISSELLSLPIYPFLKQKDLNKIINVLNSLN